MVLLEVIRVESQPRGRIRGSHECMWLAGTALTQVLQVELLLYLEFGEGRSNGCRDFGCSSAMLRGFASRVKYFIQKPAIALNVVQKEEVR